MGAAYCQAYDTDWVLVVPGTTLYYLQVLLGVNIYTAGDLLFVRSATPTLNQAYDTQLCGFICKSCSEGRNTEELVRLHVVGCIATHCNSIQFHKKENGAPPNRRQSFVAQVFLYSSSLLSKELLAAMFGKLAVRTDCLLQ